MIERSISTQAFSISRPKLRPFIELHKHRYVIYSFQTSYLIVDARYA